MVKRVYRTASDEKLGVGLGTRLREHMVHKASVLCRKFMYPSNDECGVVVNTACAYQCITLASFPGHAEYINLRSPINSQAVQSREKCVLPQCVGVPLMYRGGLIGYLPL